MIVSELIEILKTIPQDYIVLVDAPTMNYNNVKSINLLSVVPSGINLLNLQSIGDYEESEKEEIPPNNAILITGRTDFFYAESVYSLKDK